MIFEYEQDWAEEIATLKDFFGEADFPLEIMLNESEVISNIPKFMESHFSFVEANNGNLAYLPYLNRLRKVRDILQIKSTEILENIGGHIQILTPSIKRRGRPKKVNTEIVPEIPKPAIRRGRPKKVATDIVPEIPNPASRRGRPKKNNSEVIKKRGRPRKI
jgi:hypothetical protein